MAAITPVTDKSTAGYVDPSSGLYGGLNAINASMITTATVDNGGILLNRNGLQLSVFHFVGVSDNDTWDGTSTVAPPRNVIVVAFQGDDDTDDRGGVTLTTTGAGQTDPVITFSHGSGGDGWLWVLHQT